MTTSEGKKSDREDDDRDNEEPPEDEGEGPKGPGPEEKRPEDQEPSKNLDRTPEGKQKRAPPTVLPKPKPKAKPLGEVPTLISSFGDRTAPEGSLVRLDVVVKSETSVNAEWRKNDEVINLQDFSHFTVISEGNLYSLLITETSEIDSAVYTCLLTNNAGTAKCSATLKITGRFLLDFWRLLFRVVSLASSLWPKMHCKHSLSFCPFVLSVVCHETVVAESLIL